MDISHKFKTRWWLWGCLSFPIIAYLLLRVHENKAGDTWSDLGFMFYAIRDPEHYGWRYCKEDVFWDILGPLVLGWVVHCLLVVGWESLRRRHEEASRAT